MTEQEIRVHNAHCCQAHGCKYGDDDCPVVAGHAEGVYCEECEDEWYEWNESVEYL